jgi:hypothetical protein
MTLTEKIQYLIGDGGREYTPIKRPKGFRKRSDKFCFWNAAMRMIEDESERAQYVEGFASVHGFTVHHAWITLDGVHAIETTWKEPGTFYFGIKFDRKIIAHAVLDKSATVSQINPAVPMIVGEDEL